MKQKMDASSKNIFAKNALVTSTVNNLKYMPNELIANDLIAKL